MPIDIKTMGRIEREGGRGERRKRRGREGFDQAQRHKY